MKKILLFTVAIIYSFAVKGQQVQLTNHVSIYFPQNTQSITQEQALAHAGKKFNNDNVALDTYLHMHYKYIYKIDDIILILFITDRAHKYDSARVTKSKKMLDELNGDNKTYTSYIEKGNDNSAVVINYKAGSAGYYHFYCFNYKNIGTLTGILEYDDAEAAEATTILKNLLASIKFKD